MPNMGSLLEEVLGRGTAAAVSVGLNPSMEIQHRFAPFDGDTKTIIEKLATEHGLFWGDSMVLDGKIQEDVACAEVYLEMEEKLWPLLGRSCVSILTARRDKSVWQRLMRPLWRPRSLGACHEERGCRTGPSQHSS
ncbi:hypothetical protein DPSP01_013346 [Paraphaeosphaeria sporulosa]